LRTSFSSPIASSSSRESWRHVRIRALLSWIRLTYHAS
jgi:hypothetical protein